VQAEASADLRAAVEGAIDDPGRETDALALLEQFESDVATLRESMIERRAELRRLNADYDTTREELSTYAATMESRIQDNRRRILEARGRLVAATTADEWDAITKADTKAMKTIARSMQSL
jgi:predicted  nucleic acid-binding Zn-ribbon protein